MLTPEEQAFILYWVQERERRKVWYLELAKGLPLGFLFSLPILVVLFSGRYWYKRAEAVANAQSSPWILLIAVFLLAIFMSFFYRQYKWERREQKYQELIARYPNGKNSL